MHLHIFVLKFFRVLKEKFQYQFCLYKKMLCDLDDNWHKAGLIELVALSLKNQHLYADSVIEYWVCL